MLEKPFAVLLLREFDAAEARRKELLLFLTLAYLLSEHIPFALPMPNEQCAWIDTQFDEVIRGLALKSKGIVYLKDLTATQHRALLAEASFLLTDEVGAMEFAHEQRLPCVALRPDTQGMRAELHCLEQLSDRDLKSQIVGCARLINVLSDGFLSRGHFSLSW
ncbi:MAG: hypothetical protein U0Y68_21080 [Blastocatellia bacterium]